MAEHLPTGQARAAAGDLFREDAIEQFLPVQKQIGSRAIWVGTPMGVRWLTWALVGSVIIGAAFAMMASYARTEPVSGWVVPEGGLIRLNARQDGVVEKIWVQSGQEVAAGKPLVILRVSNSVLKGDIGSLQLESLNRESKASLAQVTAEIQSLEATRGALLTKRRVLRSQIGELGDMIAIAEQQGNLSEAALGRAEELSTRGFVSKNSLDEAKSKVLASKSELGTLRTQRLDLQDRLSEAQSTLDKYPTDLALLQQRRAEAEASLRQREINMEAQNRLVLVAPFPSRVVALPVHLGETLRESDAAVVLAPRERTLMAELYLPSRSVGFIKRGQKVALKLDAFPFQKFGTVPAVVEEISDVLLTPDEVRAPGVTAQVPTMRVRARILQNKIQAYGSAVRIPPGSTLTANIVIDRRSLVQWLLDPIYAARSQ